MYDRMIREHGYSIRKLAEKLGKDKGYLENRLRLADAPPEVRELVSLRKDTLSHAYELMKVDGPEEATPAGRPGRAQRAVAGQAPREDRGPARPDRRRRRGGRPRAGGPGRPSRPRSAGRLGRPGPGRGSRIADDSLVAAKQQLNEAVEELLGVIRNQDVLDAIGQTDRANLAKYLTIAKLRLENAIAVVRTGDTDR